MTTTELIDAVRRHVESQGAKCSVWAGRRAGKQTLTRAEAALGFALPTLLREFYRTVGNGFSLHWVADKDDLDQPFANFEVPTLSKLVKLDTFFRGSVVYSPEQAEKYGFPYTKDPALAKRTAARMAHWLPVIYWRNGDQICLDLGAPGTPAVYDQHDWFDGGSGDNGHVLAADWGELLAAWGGVCFQFPVDLWWPPCLRAGGGVDWGAEHFREPYRLATAPA